MEASSSKEKAVRYLNNMDADPGELDETSKSSEVMVLIKVERGVIEDNGKEVNKDDRDHGRECTDGSETTADIA